MNRYRMQFAPRSWQPKLKPNLVRMLRPFRLKHQYRSQRLTGLNVQNSDVLRKAIAAGHGVLLMPNHPSHADPFSIYMLGDEVGTPLHVMATWHVFHDQSWLTRLLLQWHGCFSVDREANDIGAFRLAVSLLESRKEPLVIFPEGEIYHCNERVTPFRDGAAAIAVAAARRAKRPIVCIPCAISYRYLSDPTPQLETLMGQLEETILWKKQTHERLDRRIYRFAEALLALKEIEYLGSCRGGDLVERIVGLRDAILHSVEDKLEISGGEASLPERVKTARRTIIERLSKTEESPAVDQAASAQQLNEWLEDLFLVVQSFSYPGDYVIQRPSVERMSETLDKFEEDVLKRPTATIRGERTVSIKLGSPIVVSADKKQKSLASDLSRQVESEVQKMLEEMRGPSAILQSESRLRMPVDASDLNESPASS